MNQATMFHGARLSAAALSLLVLSLPSAFAQAAPSAPKLPVWVERSNENTKVLLAIEARFEPEGAAQAGVEGIDENITDLKPGFRERRRQALREAISELRQRLAAEKDRQVRQDLEILIQAAEREVRGSLLREKYEVPYSNVGRSIFFATRGLLDDQIPESRRPAALVRLKRYTGMEEGYRPVTEVGMELTREAMENPALLTPFKSELEKDLGNSARFVEGIGQLFARYKINGYEEAYARLKEQLSAYDDFLRKEVLPKARTDFRLPPELYAFQLEQFGVDIPPAELAAKAHAAFDATQAEMQAIAAKIAKQRKFPSSDYRDVIRELKKEQLVGEAILPHYLERLKDIEAIIRRERLVTLPEREARIRLATPAESAAVPAPNMRPPRLLGNTGEMGEFILPLNIPAPPGSKEATQRMDDFTYAAASWTLAAHEARPGHEMQFAALVEKGVSTARALYAFNSTNAEGWGLYAESIMKPYEPLEGQLITLQALMQRAARAFLDPELQAGKLTPEQAFRRLKDDVGLSDALANQEVERYTFRAPGQATSYFYGFSRLKELRAELEKAMGAKFDQQKFHDFVLSQGIVPPDLLRNAAREEFLDAKPKTAGQ